MQTTFKRQIHLGIRFPLRCYRSYSLTGYMLVVPGSFVIVATLLCLPCIRGKIATAFDSRCHPHLRRRRCCRIRIHSTTFALLLCLPSLNSIPPPLSLCTSISLCLFCQTAIEQNPWNAAPR